MRRAITIAVLLLLAALHDLPAQIARCSLAARPYGFGGICRTEPVQVSDSQPQQIRFPDSVRVWTTAGPEDPPPWRGNLSLRGTEVAFEIARGKRGSRRDPLVLRTGLFWLRVMEWGRVESAQVLCAACDRRAGDVLLVLDLATPPPATEDDIVILRTVLAGLDRITSWNRQEAQTCSAGNPASIGLFCLLYGAVEARMGRYHHRQPALQLVRSVIAERWRDRIISHQLVDFNNHSATTMADLRTLLQVALERARAQAQSGNK